VRLIHPAGAGRCCTITLRCRATPPTLTLTLTLTTLLPLNWSIERTVPPAPSIETPRRFATTMTTTPDGCCFALLGQSPLLLLLLLPLSVVTVV
jgi:O-antigen ligase